MHRYRVFGGVFASTLSFPELPVAEEGLSVDWTLERADRSIDSGEWVECGASPVEGDIGSTLYRSPGGSLRLVYDDTGVFDIDASGRRIVWSAPVPVDEVRARKDVLGRVFALAFHQAGVLTLHGSAVAIGGRGLCFLAPKFHGKSTTAAALVDAGGTLLADDLVVVDDPGGEPVLRPTLATVHLWPDSARHVGRGAREVEEAADQSKVQVAYDALSRRPVPLDGIYLLVPTEGPESDVRRQRIDATMAAMGLLGQLKVGDLLGPGAVLDLLPAATALARRVGIHRLEVPRDLDRLPLLVDRLQGWHARGGDGP